MQPDSSQVFQLIGLLYAEMKMPENAKAALQRAVEVAPNSTSAHDALGLWYESMHDIEAAENEYRKGASLDPNDWESRVALTRIRALKSPERGADFEGFVPQ
jgi:Tfp pilus assembly protein PilF